MTDPYEQQPNPYGEPYGSGPDPYRAGQPNPYDQPNPYHQPNPHGQPGQHGGRSGSYDQPGQYGGRPDPYTEPDPYSRGPFDNRPQYGQPDPYGGQPDPYGGQADPYGGQPDPYWGRADPYRGQYGRQDPYRPPDPYPTVQFEPGQFGPAGQGGDPHGRYRGSYGPPTGWGGPGGGGRPPVPPPRSKLPFVLLSALAVLVIVGGVLAAAMLVDDDAPAAQSTSGSSKPSAGPQTSEKAPTVTRTSASELTQTSQPPNKTFEAGQCATLTPESGNRATLNRTQCGTDQSDVLVAKVQDADCVADYITFNADVGKVYCLALDAEEGSCFRLDQLAKRSAECTAGTHRVAKIFNDVSDKNMCDSVPNADKRYAYPEPARTICLVPTG